MARHISEGNRFVMEIERGRGGKVVAVQLATGVAWEKGGNTVVVHLYREEGWLVLRARTESVFLALYSIPPLLFFVEKEYFPETEFSLFFSKGGHSTRLGYVERREGGDQHTKGANKGLSRERSTFISSILISSQSVLPPLSPPPFPAANSREGWRRGEKKEGEGSPLSKKIIPPPSTGISRRDKT